ncbi:hypothetical protein [Faecalibacterium sp.]|uniref:InlB B-repeat-containing protein n=1 Tax=Faecalibacterium sp. TaxID=1971605 RepID=UPI00352738E4
MKQGKLIRRAVSVALAGCMMFTLSAPALAASTDDLLQQSTAAKSAVNVLDAENGDTVDYGITITIYGKGKVKVDSSNCNNILGFLKYDPDEQKLTLLNPSADAVHYLTIDAPDTDVVLESTNMIVNYNLLIENARSVKVSSNSLWAPVYGKVYIYCACPVTLEHTSAGVNSGVAISGIEFAAPVSASDFVYYTSDAPDATPTDAGTGTIPANTVNYLRIEPRETYYSITVANGTAQVGDDTTGQITTAFEGEKVTVKANAPTDEDAAKGVKFHHWKVEEGNISVDPTAGSLGSATEAGTEEISFDMPKGNVKLTAVYSIPASVLRNTVTVEGGKAKSTLGEGSGISAEIGTKVEISADTEEHPDKVFVKWEIVYPENFPENVPEELQLKLEEPNRAKTTFEMPAYPVKLIAHWSAIDPDESLDPGAGYDASSAAGGAIAAVAVGGAAIWGGYEITTRVILHNLLPEGAAIPANRGQLALLVWNTAGRPESAGAPAFADVADPDMAKAAQWCTEQGIMDAKGDRFEPEGWTPKFKVIEVWNKAFPKQ